MTAFKKKTLLSTFLSAEIAFLIKKKCPFKIVSDVSYVLKFNTELFGVKTFSLCIADLIILPFLCMISRMFIDKSISNNIMWKNLV